ncbi:hypothetical protein N7532_007847 [Penicillium argentinense]|uniref:Zn(2)-C6 fungal-type domain-containing protein n=1 Tax=Penicillium argentinense TaxID=1131581 RepID=A0A9W9EW74_9EURO|nr:uncharacterized protein N7532_007847 [Penicillium argentinense]KAJ5089163.1 hypothetical protein N7532_007847 [Penicillium argentinense]
MFALGQSLAHIGMPWQKRSRPPEVQVITFSLFASFTFAISQSCEIQRFAKTLHNAASCRYCPLVVPIDLFRRHIRTYHPQRELPPSRKYRAYSACHARKVRCEGVLPCNACQHRDVFCVHSGGETVSEQQFSIDDSCPLSPVSTINDSVSDAPGGLLMTILIFTLILFIQDGRFSIEVHLTSPTNLVYLFNLLSPSDFG